MSQSVQPTAAAPSLRAPPAVPSLLQLRPGLDTPRRLRAILAAVCAFAGLLFASGEVTLEREHRVLSTVARDAAPSIVAAQELAVAIADLDAGLAAWLLSEPRLRERAAAQIQARRASLTSRLVDAAQNITYGEVERRPVTALLDGLVAHAELAGQARWLRDHGDDDGARLRYRESSLLVHGTLLPSTAALDLANRSAMDEVYAAQQRAAEWWRFGLAASGALLLLALFTAQLFLVRRTRRLLNPALALATLVAAGGLWADLRAVSAANRDLRVAKEDAFESIHALWKSRAIAADMIGDQVRWLLDPARRGEAKRAFDENVGRLTSDADLERALSPLAAEGRPRFHGLFADELGNLTFAGEREAALDMVRAFARVLDVDRRVRALELGGQHAQAVALALGAGDGQGHEALERFDRALGRTLEVNQREYERAIAVADGGLRGARPVGRAAAALVALLALFGVRQRLREYGS